MKGNKITGAVAEQTACDYLVRAGYRILERNYRSGRFAEIDIIAEEECALVGIEVKCVNSPWEDLCIADKVPPMKIAKIRGALCCYCSMNKLRYDTMRIDVIMVRQGKLIHYKNVEF